MRAVLCVLISIPRNDTLSIFRRVRASRALGEWIGVTRNWSKWIMAGIIAGFICRCLIEEMLTDYLTVEVNSMVGNFISENVSCFECRTRCLIDAIAPSLTGEQKLFPPHELLE